MTYDYYRQLLVGDRAVSARARYDKTLPPVVGDDESWWRPRELLVHVEAVDELSELLADIGAVRFDSQVRNWRNDRERRTDPEFTARVREASGHELWVIPADSDSDIDVRSVVEKGRQTLGRRDRSLALNTVFAGEGYYMGGPGSTVTPADEPTVLPSANKARGDTPVILSVLDTGVPVDWPNQHYRLQGFIDNSDVTAPTDMDLLDSDGNSYLDRQAAHGLFICGLVNRAAAELRIDPDRVLDPFGLGDEAQIIDGLSKATGAVINLSLGGYAMDNEPPPALATAVARIIGQQRVVVAAAGNDYADKTRRLLPFYPAALPGVIAVGAYDSRTDEPADFSNRGDWVDVWAPGVDLVSDFVSAWPVEPAAGSTVTVLSGRGGIGVARDWWIDILRWRVRRSYRGWARWSGTSFAAPLVAAAIARAVMADPTNPPQVSADAFLASLPAVRWPGVAGALLITDDYTR